MWIHLRHSLRPPQITIVKKSIHYRRSTFCSVVFPASCFSSLQEVVLSKTADLYTGSPLASLSPKARGEVLALVTRNVMNELGIQDELTDALPGRCVDGRRRAQHQAECDWICNGRRIECKSSQMHFSDSAGCWYFRFSGVKLALQGHRAHSAFDDLLLVLYTPRRVYIYRHDLDTGVTTTGKSTPSRGHTVRIGSAKVSCWREALDCILSRLDAGDNSCIRVADFSLEDERIKAVCMSLRTSVTQETYENIPLASLSPPARGVVLQRLAREVDALVSPHAYFSKSTIGFDCIGRRRSEHTASFDWLRDGVRVECKSAQLVWCNSHQLWKVMFLAVKIPSYATRVPVFDELHLVLYTPRGLYIYKHDLQLGVSSTGKDTQEEGSCIVISGPRGEMAWSKGLDSILDKLDNTACRRIAHVCWTNCES